MYVVQVLTDSSDGRKYWNKLKQRLKEEGNELVTNCHQLKLKAADDKMHKTDVASMEHLFRIIQPIPSPKAEPFKLWLTKVGNARKEPEDALGKSVISSSNAKDMKMLHNE